MGERAWTPGPWEVRADSPATVRIPIDQGRVATAYGGTVANAHLIASAPELYEALSTVLKEHEYRTPAGTTNCRFCDNSMDDLGTGEDMHDPSCVVHAVKAALLKAEGKEDAR